MLPVEYHNLIWFPFPAQVLPRLEALKDHKGTLDFETVKKYNESLLP